MKARVPVYHEDGSVTYQRVDTTPGRLFLGNYLPKHYKMPYELVNQVMTSNEISSLVDDVYRHCGQNDGHHHHLICSSCGLTITVEGPAIENWTEKVAKENGFSEVSHKVDIFGVCKSCRKK